MDQVLEIPRILVVLTERSPNLKIGSSDQIKPYMEMKSGFT